MQPSGFDQNLQYLQTDWFCRLYRHQDLLPHRTPRPMPQVLRRYQRRFVGTWLG